MTQKGRKDEGKRDIIKVPAIILTHDVFSNLRLDMHLMNKGSNKAARQVCLNPLPERKVMYEGNGASFMSLRRASSLKSLVCSSNYGD